MMLRCCLQGVLTQVERRGCCTGTLHILRLSYLDTGGSGGGGLDADWSGTRRHSEILTL